MVAHVSKNIADKFYTLIDNQIITNVKFFVPNINSSNTSTEKFCRKFKKMEIHFQVLAKNIHSNVKKTFH